MKRREFIGLSLGAAGALAFGLRRHADSAHAAPTKFVPDADLVLQNGKSASDRVALGKSGVKVSIVGIGTGTLGSGHQSNQTRLGQEQFTHIMRHALDKNINFFDLADQYGSNPFFARAMQGVAREKYVIQTKLNSRDAAGARADIDRILSELKTDYIDSLIVHCVTEADWATRFRGVLDVFEEAKQKGKIRAHGVTCHSFDALQATSQSEWVQITMVRWNSQRSHMDAGVETAGALFGKMRAKGQGMVGMKVMGQGDILRSKALLPEECCRFQIESGVVDAFVVGVQSTEEVDALLRGTQRALDEVGYRTVRA